ncbi:hypothetical protein FB446DRAFT_722613 [Lentinula raphanica]|nr:hypothetical protein FB446DRAFT_722613 [Lentinula raphanica]
MENHLDALLHSNLAPSEEDIDHIMDIRSESAPELDRMNTEVMRLEFALRSAKAKRNELQKKYDIHRSILSPLRRCSTEILQQIFTWTLEPFPLLASHESPLLLGQVCSRWRSISLRTPELWNAVHVVISTGQEFDLEYSRRRNATLHAWLQRAGARPLYLSLHFEDPYDVGQQDVPQVTDALEVLVPFCKQWKYLNLQVHNPSVPVLEALRGLDVPLLESVIILRHVSWEDDFDDDRARYPSFLSTAPSLKHIIMDNFGPFVGSVVPCHQLTFFSLHYSNDDLGIRGLVQILTECKALRECVLVMSIIHDTQLSSDFHRPMPLPHLQKLTITGSPNIMAGFLDLLCLPSLQHLHVLPIESNLTANNAGLPSDVLLLTAVKSLLHRSKCPLDNLRLVLRRSSSLTTSLLVVELMEMVPSLKALWLDDPVNQNTIINEELLNALSTPETSLCPLLASIQIPDKFTCSESILERFLVMRLEKIPSLEMVVSPRGGGWAKRVAHFGNRVQVTKEVLDWSQPEGRPDSRLVHF